MVYALSKPTVIGWKKRYVAEDVGGLQDRPKPGRCRAIDKAAVVTVTLEAPHEQHCSVACRVAAHRARKRRRVRTGQLPVSHSLIWIVSMKLPVDSPTPPWSR